MILNKNVNQKALYEFVQKFKKIGHLQQMGIIHKGEEILKFSIKPYEITDSKQLFSISKTFTSMAIGLAIEEGKIGLHDKVIDYFRGMPLENVSPYLEKMEIYHLLNMTTGHDECVMYKIGPTPNPIKAFLELPIQYEPGTHFAYNTAASLMLAAIHKIATGMDLDEYLKPMLEALEIKDYYFEKIGGLCLGGVGTHVNIDALLNFGSMLLNKGMFKGKQVVPAKYVEMATTKQIDSIFNGTPDWTCGYGLHLWMGQEGFRCDGAFGQLIICLPDRQMVIAVQSHVYTMQEEVDFVMEFVNKLYETSVVEDLENKINEIYKIEKTTPFEQECKFIVEPNILKIDEIHIIPNVNSITIEFNGDNAFKLEAGNGEYCESRFWASSVKKKLDGMMPFMYEESIVSSYYKYEQNTLDIVMKNRNTPLIQNIVIDVDRKVVNINNFELKLK